MGKGSKRAYKVVPVEGDEPAFGDPPRNWGRVASMAGVWAIVLFAGAWMAPGFASGGNEDDTDARDQPATDEINAASRYLRFGSDGDTERAEAVLCDGASPDVTPADLVDMRATYETELGSYPETEVETTQPIMSADGAEIDATLSFIAGNSFREEGFTVTVKVVDESYCVTQVVRHVPEPDDPGTEVDPQELAARYLSAVFVVRDNSNAAGYQCPEYEGTGPQELSDALVEWESVFGEATAIQNFDGAPISSGDSTVVPMSVELTSGQAVESFTFELTISEGCVAALTGGEELLDPSDD